MYENIKPEGYKFTLKHFGKIIAFILLCLDIYSIKCYFTNVEIYPWNFVFWKNWILGIVFCLVFPLLIYGLFCLIALIGARSAHPRIEKLFDDEPQNIKYYVCEKRSESHWKIEMTDTEFIRIFKPEVNYAEIPDVVACIYRLKVDTPLNFWQKLCLGPIDNQINAEIVVPEQYREKPSEYLTYDGAPTCFPDIPNIKYKKEFTLKKGPNTYAFMDKIGEMLDKKRKQEIENKKSQKNQDVKTKEENTEKENKKEPED